MDQSDFNARLERAVQALEADRSHGASELARWGMRIAGEAAREYPAADTPELLGGLREIAGRVARTRPSMAPVWNLMQQWREQLGQVSTDELDAVRLFAAAAASEIEIRSQNALLEAARNAANAIAEGSTVITHSFSTTVAEVFRLLREHKIHVILSESRPLCEGRQLAASLANMGLSSTYITDAQIGHFVSQADVALSGADCILENGAVVNKSGTYLLALAARAQGIPFFVCSEHFKQRVAGMEEFRLEEMDPGEMDPPKLPGLTAANIYFDVTPPELVSRLITDREQN